MTLPEPLSGRTRRLAYASGVLAAVSLVAAACGGGGGTGGSKASATATTTTTAAATSSSGGSGAGGAGGVGGTGGGTSTFGPAAFGKIASISGDTLEVQNTETGQTTVDLTSKTLITATVSAKVSDVTAGVCITAIGTKGPGGAVDATTVTISPSTNGSCGRGAGIFGGPGGGRFPGSTGSTFPSGRSGSVPRTTVTRPANFASASGKVTSVSGSTITVQALSFSFSGSTTSTSTGPRTVTVTSSTKYSRFERLTAAGLKVGESATAIGSTNHIGAVTARSLSVSQATSQGCSLGFGGGGGFGGGRGGFGGGGFFRGGAGGGGAGGGAAPVGGAA